MAVRAFRPFQAAILALRNLQDVGNFTFTNSGAGNVQVASNTHGIAQSSLLDSKWTPMPGCKIHVPKRSYIMICPSLLDGTENINRLGLLAGAVIQDALLTDRGVAVTVLSDEEVAYMKQLGFTQMFPQDTGKLPLLHLSNAGRLEWMLDGINNGPFLRHQ